jgi:hypothetical protein
MEGIEMAGFESTVHFPRSSNLDWHTLMDIHGSAPETIDERPIDLRHAQFHPAGERRITESELVEWRKDLNSWAHDNGFPGQLNEERRSRWDVLLGTRLLEDTQNLPESQHPAVWSWIATHLLPHFVVYRWGWPAKKGGEPPHGREPWARFGDSDKNALLMARQRVRAYGRDLALKATEQEFQSIQYRPAFGIDQRVARIVLESLITAWEDPGSNYGKKGGTRALDANYVCIELRLVNSLRPLAFAADNDVASIVDDIVERLPDLRKTTDRPDGFFDIDSSDYGDGPHSDV